MDAMDEITSRLKSSTVGVQPLVAVLRAISRGDAEGNAVTRASLSERLNLSAATISKAVTDLVDTSTPLVAEHAGRPDGGRKQKLLSLNDEKYSVVGIQINDQPGLATQLVCAETRLDGSVLSASQEVAADDPSSVAGRLTELATSMIATAQARPRAVLGVAIRLGGQIHEGRVVRSVNRPWDGLDLGPKLQAELGLTTVVENRVTSLMVLDHLTTQRTAQWPNRALVAVFDDGVGGALVIDGRVYRGTHGLAGKLSHAQVDYSDTAQVCRCGRRDCLETRVTPSAIRSARDSGVSEGDAYAAAGTALGRALVNLIQVADPGHIRLLVPVDFRPADQPAAQRLHASLDIELGRLFSPDSRPDLVFDYFDAESLARQHASAASATVIEALIDRVQGR